MMKKRFCRLGHDKLAPHGVYERDITRTVNGKVYSWTTFVCAVCERKKQNEKGKARYAAKKKARERDFLERRLEDRKFC